MAAANSNALRLMAVWLNTTLPGGNTVTPGIYGRRRHRCWRLHLGKKIGVDIVNFVATYRLKKRNDIAGTWVTVKGASHCYDLSDLTGSHSGQMS